MTLPLRINDLTKVYKSGRSTRTAVDSLSLEVPRGIAFGFMGPNGAGKTTTIKTVLDFIRPTSGSAELFGLSSSEFRARSRVGYLPEQPYFHRFLKPMEVVMMHAALAGIPRNEAKKRAIRALERARIDDYADTPISKLSKGLTQRVGIAQAIVADPDLLILDEPASGLDPVGRRHIRDLLAELKNEGKTIFLSSHFLSEVEQLCDMIAVLRQGKLVFLGKPEEAKAPNDSIRVKTNRIDARALDQLKYQSAQVEQSNGATVITTSPSELYPLVRVLEEIGASIISVETAKESMEEAFLRLAA
jgi:ABC-2 type transport system ATP-binding protein